MNPIDYIIILIVLLIIGAALFYIIRAKKKGQKCIGCPFSKTCNKNTCNKKINNKYWQDYKLPIILRNSLL